MEEIKYYKTENEFEDICVVNGLCKILQDNDIEYYLIAKKSHYLIQAENFNNDELCFCDIDISDANNIHKGYIKYKERTIKELNEFFNSNINNVFNMIQDKKILSNKKEDCLLVGTHFYTKSFRIEKSNATLKTSEIIRNLAFFGHIYSTSMAENNNVQIISVLIPKNNEKIINIIKPVVKKVQKKDGTIINLTRLNDYKEVEVMATNYIQTVMEFFHHKHQYKKVLMMVLDLTGNNVMANKTYSIDMPEYSYYTYESLNQILSYTKNYNVRDITAKFIIFKRYDIFSKLLKTYAQSEQKIGNGEEIINMYGEQVQKIFNNKSIKKIGGKLNYLLYKNKGFDILTKLYYVNNTKMLVNVIRHIVDNYKRYISHSAIDDVELQDIVNLIKTQSDAQICADAIISYARVFKKEEK